jgi:membrane-bound lytic murein transglycosylase MltF
MSTGWAKVRDALSVCGLAALLAGCGPEKPPAGPQPVVAAEPSSGGEVAELPEAPSPLDSIAPKLLAPWTGDFDGMVERRVLRVLVAPSKTYYFVENGRQRGATFEALSAFGDEVNRKLKTGHVKFVVAFVPVSRADLIPALVAGRGDVAASGITITDERSEKVDFTRPTWDGVSEIVVTGPASPPLATIDDLAGKEIFVRQSSSYREHLERLSQRFVAAGKAPVKLVPAPEDLEDEDLLELLNAGAFEIAVLDAPIAKLWAQIFPDIRAREDLVVHSGGKLAWMIRKGSPKLKAELDAFIGTHGQGTAFGNTIAKRYGKSTQFLQSSTSPEEIRKFQQMVSLFRSYSERYRLDYLLAMAQGYQESRLDQKVRSQVGAVGVMQVMPATGEELATGDIRQLEPNIHAGVKYIRFMIDRYFENEPMTPLNKMLFAFAAYNAGHARVAKLRKEAAERGLDPNVWFNHVELVAADRIGAETPTYVSNIYKYYIAYKLLADRVEVRDRAKAAVAGR